MNIDAVAEMLNNIPISRSQYEFKNFNLETYGTFPRQVRAMLIEKESLYYQQNEIEAEIELLEHEIATLNGDNATIMRKKLTASIGRFKRQLNDIKKQAKQVDDWLDSQDPEECQDAIDNFEE